MSVFIKAISQEKFLVCAAVFVAMALGLRPAADATTRWLTKKAVPIRRPLREFDRAKLPGFRFIEDTGEGSAEAVETDEYIEWHLSPVGRKGKLKRRQVAYLNVYYYTQTGSGRKLLIPHTPEVCYGQGGNQVTALGTVEIPTPALAPEIESVSAKYVRMSHPTDPDNKDICVVYLFCVNGRFHSDREEARMHLAVPWTRAVWFAKIDCTTKVPRSGHLSGALDVCKRMLGEAIPELVRNHFPTEKDIEESLRNESQ